MVFSFFDSAENIVGKGENAGSQHFLLFPQCFQKPLLLQNLIKLVFCDKRINQKRLDNNLTMNIQACKTLLACINDVFKKTW